MQGFGGRIRGWAVILALAALGGTRLPAQAQGSEPHTPTPTQAIIIVLPSPTATTGSFGIQPSSTPTGSSVQPPTATPAQAATAVATTAVPFATATATRPSPTSETSGVSPTETREPTSTATDALFMAGGVDNQGEGKAPASADPEPSDGDPGKYLALAGLLLTGGLGAGLLGIGLLRGRRGKAAGHRTYDPYVFRKRIDKASPSGSDREDDISADPSGPGKALPDPILDDRSYQDIDRASTGQSELATPGPAGREGDPERPIIHGRMWNAAGRSGGHSGWIEIQSVDQGGSAGARPRLMQHGTSGVNPPPAGFRGVHFSYEDLANHTSTSAQQVETAFDFIHRRLQPQAGKWFQGETNFEPPDPPGDSGAAGVEVRGWDVANKKPVSDSGDHVAQFNFEIEIEEVRRSSDGQGTDHNLFNPEGTPVHPQSSQHSGGANMLMGDGKVHPAGSDVVVWPNGDMLALKEQMAVHTGMSPEQVEELYLAIGKQIESNLPAALRWAQILWRLIPV
ncbi:MAG: H-X9-DG-CTERM domain-containing protein [Anaerolineales bacterium]